jgi:hypothetical protein
MLTFLRGKASQRHLQLFAAFCARRTIPLLLEDRTDPEWAPSVQRDLAIVERFLEGQATREDVGNLDFGAYDRTGDYAAWAVCSAMEACRDEGEAGYLAAEGASYHAIEARVDDAWRKNPDKQSGNAFEAVEEGVRAAEMATQAVALRDIIGNPFRPGALDPTWLNLAVVSLAQSVYAEGFLSSGELDNATLAVLADALEEAGCSDAEVLGHLRGPGPHVPGCWPVDLIRARK